MTTSPKPPPTLLAPKSEKRPDPIPFRCPSALKARLEARAKATGRSRNKVIETVLTFGLDLWGVLEPDWERIKETAGEREAPRTLQEADAEMTDLSELSVEERAFRRESRAFAEAVRRLVRAGLAAGKKR